MSSEHMENKETQTPAPDPEATPHAAPDFLESDEDCAVFLRRDQISETPPVPARTLTFTRGQSTRKFTSLLKRLLPVLPVLAALSGVCWALTCLLDFDWGIGHIVPGSVWFVLMAVFLLLGLAAVVCLMIPARRTRQYRFPAVGTGEFFCSFFGAALLGFRTLQQVWELFFTSPDSASGSTTLIRLSAFALLVCALYFLCLGLNRKGGIMTILSMGSCAAVMLILFRDYFDFTLPLNSPLRNLSMLSYAALLLFFLAETRMHVDLWYTGVPFSVFAYSAVILLTGSAAIGQTILVFTGISQFSLIEEIAFVSIAALAFFRLQKLSAVVGDHLPPPPTEDEVKKLAKKNKR